jgi:hypothetical protein
MPGLLTRRVQVAAKIEVTKGTAETLAAANAKLLAYEPVFNFDPTQFKRNPYRKTISRMNSIPGQRLCELTLQCEVMGPPFANKGTSSIFATLLRACAFSESLSAGVSSTYVPISTGYETITLAVYEDGVVKKLCGAMGNVRLILKVGEPIMAEFTFQGKYSTHSDTALLSPTYPASLPLIFQNATVTVFGDSLLMQNLEINMQNTVVMRDKPQDVTGFDYAIITERNPIMTFDPEAELVATHDFMAKLISTTEAAVSIVIVATDNTELTISLPKARYTGLPSGDRDGVRTYSATCELNMNSGDDEVSLVFAGTSTSTTTTSTSTTSTTSTSTTLA